MRSGAAKVCPECGKIKLLSEFRDLSLCTGIGRFCLDCKSESKNLEYYPVDNYYSRKADRLSKSDMNRLLSFSKDPSKYTVGTHKASEKVYYLDTISYKFNEDQLEIYEEARKKYNLFLAAKKEVKIQKVDYSATLVDAFKNRRSVKICYKGHWRTIDPYSLDQTYIVAYCHFAHGIRTFRVDRIQGAESLSDGFNFDKSLEISAQGKLREAPNYKGH